MFNDEIKVNISAKFKERAKFAEDLAPYVAYKIGGPADLLVFPNTEEELFWLTELSERNNIPITFIGSGTNLLVRDEGIRGIVIILRNAFSEIKLIDNSSQRILVQCGGGVLKPDLLNWAIEKGYSGLEFSAGVPGTIGGGIFMNAGTKYGCYGDILRKIRLFNFKGSSKGPVESKVDRASLGYREQKIVNENLVLWTLFELTHGDPIQMRREVERIIAEREEKQPLNFPSCGSTFKNPEGHSAGRLIEKAGLKGLTVGGAEISLKHANFILNKGNAKASDILTLISIIKEAVRLKFSVELECEVIVLGGENAKKQIPHQD
jgi:UDP-N-acetylmuramate dehydrogenase